MNYIIKNLQNSKKYQDIKQKKPDNNIGSCFSCKTNDYISTKNRRKKTNNHSNVQ